MRCPEMEEPQASCDNYAERRHTVVRPESERRTQVTGSRRLGQFRVAYLIQNHRRNCDMCRSDV
jgi:hypothetical protein